jgi:hypothetical protein
MAEWKLARKVIKRTGRLDPGKNVEKYTNNLICLHKTLKISFFNFKNFLLLLL